MEAEPMRLDALIADLDARRVRGGDVDLTDLVEDSRQVQPGCAFLAREGDAVDGRDYIADALQRGAAAILTDTPPPADLPDDIAWVQVSKADTRLAAELAERFFGYPSQALRLIGVTGTNGKTTTAGLIQHLLNHAGVSCGLIGTLGVKVPGSSNGGGRRDGQPETRNQKLETNLTTPGPIDFSRILAAMRDRGCRAAVTEVSSHALEQGRVAALRFAVGVFTNLTGDHLDYHGSMDAYAAAKAKLFTQLNDHPGGWAVVNVDDAYSQRMLEAFQGPPSHVMRCTLHGDTAETEWNGQLHCGAIVLNLAADHSRARFDGPWGSVETKLPLVGRHNVSNALQAAAAAHAVVDLSETLRHALAQCPPVPGRLERVPSSEFKVPGSGNEGASEEAAFPAVLVDYAHTHDALENVLLALRPLTKGRLLLVFGCGGDRDREKRPKMAQVAARFADALWITSDNPRSEDPQRIINDIVAGISSARGSGDAHHVVPDRAQAIRQAVLAAHPDDTVLIAGKGHEDYQILADGTIHFDDREQAAAALGQWREERSAPCRPSK